MKKLLINFVIIFLPSIIYAQGINNTWLLGNDPGWPNLGRFVFGPSSYQLISEQRKMSFKDTQATISDEQGNFFMSSNGVWIANANNDTMMNGSGLNPGANVNSHPNGLLNPYANIFLPFPGDSQKYVLIHHTDEWDGFSYPSYDIFESIIDKTLDSGLGGVISKNNIVFSDTMNWGFGACKHANGRDWWIITQKNISNVIFKILYTPNGVESITSQQLNVPIAWYNVTHLDFSSDGQQFAYSIYDSITLNSSLLLFEFDRCTGQFSNEQVLPITNGSYLWGLAFSPSGQFLYTCSGNYIFQINTVSLTVDSVATYDGFISGFPPNCCATTFDNMYLAANGKIYITSGSSVQHIHEMNYPDSAGFACDVQQHSIFLGGNYFHLRSVPNHPNYYLSAADGTICDSLGLNNVTELSQLQHNFKIAPNPNNGNFNIMYLLPQGQSGKFEIYDIEGRALFSQLLPSWSTIQQINLPENVSSGIYNCIISSGSEQINRKFALIKE